MREPTTRATAAPARSLRRAAARTAEARARARAPPSVPLPGPRRGAAPRWVAPLHAAKRTRTRYLIEVPHDPDECLWAMDEISGHGRQYAHLLRGAGGCRRVGRLPPAPRRVAGPPRFARPSMSAILRRRDRPGVTFAPRGPSGS